MTYFFWVRWHRALQMDAANKEAGKDTPFLWEATEWADAYKATLSKNKQNDFDKEWTKLEKQLESFQNGDKGAVSPFKGEK